MLAVSMERSTSEKTSLAFREVAVIPEVGQLYALSVAPDSDFCFWNASEFPL